MHRRFESKAESHKSEISKLDSEWQHCDLLLIYWKKRKKGMQSDLTLPLRNQVIQHHLILKIIILNLPFSTVLPIVCVCVGGKVRERERESKWERERTSGLSQSVRSFFFLTYFVHVMGLVLRRRNGTEKNALLLLSLLSFPIHVLSVVC